jgi:hypothetical protein
MDRIMDCFIRLYIPNFKIDRPDIFIGKKYDYLDLNCVTTTCITQSQAYEKCLYENNNNASSDCSEFYKEYIKCFRKEALIRN